MADQEATIVGTVRVEKLACIECQHVMDVSHLPSFSSITCQACGAPQTVPAKFGSFLLLNRLGAGGMGVIYHAVDRELGRHIALKVMKRALGDNEEFVASFRREAQSAAALNHRNVVQIYSFGQFAGQPYIAMELVDGGQLDVMIANGRALPETRALEIHLEVAEGLNAASELGLVHGDIKPANVLFGLNGEAKVVDFGLASFIGQQQQQGQQVWGTPYYIAPEKARGKKVDFRSDIYSLGAMLFHVLAGQPPFDGATPADVVVARLRQPAPSLLQYQPDLHQPTVAMVARMLQAEPALRYPSYAALLLDMRAALAASRAPLKKAKAKTARLPTIVAGAAHKSWRLLKPPPRQVFLAAGALILVGVLVAGSWWLQRQRHQASATQAAQEERTLALARGSELKVRLMGLTQISLESAAQLQTLEQQAITATQTLPSHEALLLELQEALANSQTSLNELDDQRALQQAALAAWDSAPTDPQQLAELEALFENAIVQYNLVEQSRTVLAEALTRVAAVQKRIRAEEARARQAAAAALQQQRAAEKERQAARQRAQEAERLQIQVVQGELDRLDAARAANAPLIARRQFAEAARALSALQPELTTPEAQAHYQALFDSYRILDKLKVFIVRSIRSAPYLQGWLLGEAWRDIIAADTSQGLTIALDSSGQLLMSWDQISIPYMLKITNHYLESARLAERERLEIMLGLALLCYESGQLKMAESLAAAAGQLSAAGQEEVQRLMPGLAPQP